MHFIPSTIIEELSQSSLPISEPDEVPDVEPVKSDHYLLSVIADEDTCVGYLLGGIGEINEDKLPNYFVVSPLTTDQEIEQAFSEFVSRKDMGIVLITKEIAERIHLPHDNNKNFPVVIEIPGKNGPYLVEIDDLVELAEHHDRVKEERIKNVRERRQRSISERENSHSGETEIKKCSQILGPCGH